MALDGITLKLLSDELDRTLRGCRIDKIFQPDKQTFFFHIRTDSGISKLRISLDPASPSICITGNNRENPMMPPSFCMLLRKYLSGSRIVSVSTPGYERIVEIRVAMTDELHDTRELTLSAELMGRYSNLILINGSGKILDCAVHVDLSVNRVREIMPARIYEYPPKQSKMSVEEACDLISSGSLPVLAEEINRPVGKALLNSITGLSPLLARQICFTADTDERISCSSLSPDDRARLIRAAGEVLIPVTDGTYRPSICFNDDGTPAEFSSVDLKGYPKKINTDTISDAIDMYLNDREKNRDLENRRRNLMVLIDNALAHATRKAMIHRSDAEEGSKAGIYKKYGDLLIACTYMTPQSKDELVCTDYYSEDQREIRIPLDPALSISDNAQEYYKKFRKAKRKTELAERYLKDDELATEYLRSIKAALLSADCREDLEAIREELLALAAKPQKQKKEETRSVQVGKAKSGKASSRALREAARKAANERGKKQHVTKALPYREYTTDDGYTILCGRNNIQNEELTFKVASGRDWWFHIKGLPGTHVILKHKTNEDMPSDAAVIKAAKTAAYFSRSTLIEEHAESKGTSSLSIKAEIDYCPVSHVKKMPGGKPGMVIYEGYYSIVVPVEEP